MSQLAGLLCYKLFTDEFCLFLSRKSPSTDVITFRQRRQFNDAVFMCKILKNRIECPRLLALCNFRAPSRIPRISITPLCPPLRRTVLGSNSPYARFCKVINSCSDVIDLHHDSLTKLKSTFMKSLPGP